MMRALLLSLVLFSAMPAAQVAAEEEPQAGEHHGGPVHFRDIVSLDNKPFWAALLNFGLLAYLLRRFGRQPLRDFLSGRRREMEQAMAEAAAMKQKAEQKYKEYSDRMAQLDKELEKLRADIERAAEEDKRRIVVEAEETARRLRRETESLIDQHAKALANTVRAELVEAAISTAEQLLRGALTDADQQRLAQAYSQEIAGRDGDAPARAAPPRPSTRAEGQP